MLSDASCPSVNLFGIVPYQLSIKWNSAPWLHLTREDRFPVRQTTADSRQNIAGEVRFTEL